MPTGQDLVETAMAHKGEAYVFGANVPLENPDYKGPWDCAEFASWVVYQVTGKVLGCTDNDAPLRSVEPYSGGWARDARASAHPLTLEQAAGTVGAILVRAPREGHVGHVAISRGDGTTIEAMDTAHGVTTGKADGRGFNLAFKVV